MIKELQHLFEAILDVTFSMSGPLDRSSNAFFSHKPSDRSIVYASLKHSMHGMYGCISHTKKGMNGRNYWIKTGNTQRTFFLQLLSFLSMQEGYSPRFFLTMYPCFCDVFCDYVMSFVVCYMLLCTFILKCMCQKCSILQKVAVMEKLSSSFLQDT